MAEEKKEKPLEKPAITQADPFIEIVVFLFVSFFVIYLINGLIGSISSTYLFSSGLKGFTPQGILLSHTKPISTLSNPIGARVVSIKETAVYNSAGGKQIGTQKFGARGKILDGPVNIEGDRYWYVDYNSGVDGWVKESDIASLESELSFFERFLTWLLTLTWFWKLLSILFSILFILGIIYLYMKIKKLRMNEKSLLYTEITNDKSLEVNPKWARILNHIESLNENDWRLAIIEADIMLDELLDKLFLHGETMGDKLKAVEKSDFTTIDNAWEAHKVRNQIAHEGSGFLLNQRDVHRVINLYKSVFEEFKII